MELLEIIKNKTAKVGIIGLGYVGLPLGLEFANKGFDVLGFDLDDKKISSIEEGKSYFKHISNDRIAKAFNGGNFNATTDFSKLPEVDAIIICVPTPLDEHREPDLSFIINTAKTVSQYLREGQLVVLESTTYPGTTDEILLPMFEESQKLKAKNLMVEELHDSNVQDFVESDDTSVASSFKVGKDFFLAFSPEREDPNNPDFSTSTIPKVVGGVTPQCLEVALALYNNVIVKTVPVSSTRIAEATKLLENIYRSVNIALVNELKMVFDKMNIDVWEVISAASTKPFGFQAFYPGPGLGGHCIPIDPFYLTWKAHEYDVNTKFIELAGEINTSMPYYVVEKAAEALNKFQKSLNGAKILILGASYKKDIDDMRESPSLKLIDILEKKGAVVDYYDPYVPSLPKSRHYKFEMRSVDLTKDVLKSYDLVLVSTDHSTVDYKFVHDNSKLLLDTRNAFGNRGIFSSKIVKA
ncbi:MAG: nucleotide sugar dehydrogenase [Ignavibacteriales bacterium]|nr:nucleotide sugar dehydrogenase [Ignavibacteriales bacterium]